MFARSHPRSASTAMAVAWAAIAAALLQALRYGYFHEDAYITLRYSRNLARGAGIAWNAGEMPIEGATNFLWMLVLALPARLGLDVPAVAAALGFGILVFWLLRLPSQARQMGLERGAWVLPAALGCSLAVASWSVSGLETVPAAWLTWELIWRSWTGRWRGWFLASTCLFLLRPDGLLLAGIALLLAPSRAGDGLLGIARERVPWGVALGCVMGVAIGLRLLYFGDLVPNTAYVKVEPSSASLQAGIVYIARFLGPGGGGLLALLALAVSVWPLGTSGNPARRLGIFCVVWAVYVAAVGGDYMLRGRFLVPLILPLAASAALGLEGLLHRRSVALVLWISMLPLTALSPFQRAAGETEEMRYVMGYAEAAGRALGEAYPGQLVASNAVGALAWFSDLPMIDMLGLNDRHIARHGVRDARLGPGHQLGDGTYVLDRLPDVIVPGTLNARRGPLPVAAMTGRLTRQTIVDSPVFVSDRDIVSDPRFADFDIVLMEVEDPGYPPVVLLVRSSEVRARSREEANR